MCARPGQDTATSVSGTVNTYFQASGNLSAGATTMVLGTRDTRGSATPVSVGDLIMVIQMQDGAINTSNNANYGSGSGNGQGTTSLGNAGRYEFVCADTVSGSVVTFAPALANSYVNAAATTTSGQRRYQIIRVPQCSPMLAPLLTVVPLQVFALHLAMAKGLDADQPRNLAKSVTVE